MSTKQFEVAMMMICKGYRMLRYINHQLSDLKNLVDHVLCLDV